MQHDAQLWNDLLYCSGGKLELQKCSFHVIHFTFKADGTPLPSLEKYENQIKVMDPLSQTRISIESKRATDPHKTLGHYKAPASKQRLQLLKIMEKAHKTAMLISMSPISRYGAYLAYHTIYIPSVKYPLPQSFFTQTELEQAQQKTMGQIIAKC